MKTKIAALTLALSLPLGLAACGQEEPTKTVTVTATPKASPSATSTPTATSTPAAADPASEPAPPAEGTAAPKGDTGLNDSFTLDGVQYVVTKVETGIPTLSDEYESVTAQGQFVTVAITATNTSDAPVMIDFVAQLVDSSGKTFNTSDDAFLLTNMGSLEYTEINPTQKTSGTIAFDIPAGSTPTSLSISSGMFEDEAVSVSIK